MTHGSLFSGIGGFDLAAEWMGWKNKFHCEWNEFGQKVLNYYWPEADCFGDITKSDFKKYNGTIDIISGGFPCQPFSTAGKRKGEDDNRYLWPQMLRAIKEIQPTWVVAENVYGIINQGRGLVFQQVHLDLENEGYQVQPYILPACSVGAPHKRDRVWFIAYSDQNRKMVQGRNRNSNNKEWDSKEKVQEWENKQFGVKQPNAKNDTNSYSNGQHNGNGEYEKYTDDGRKYAQHDIEQVCFNSDTECVIQQGQGRAEGRLRKEAFGNGETSWTYPNDRWPTQSALRSGNDGIPNGLAEYPISKKDYLKFSLESVGNAIVPQVAYEIFKTIEQYENQVNSVYP